jgi:hypothetical protein
VFTGRKNNYHVLDRAMLALNGYWCAQECHDQTDKWLALAIQELTAALADQNWTGNRARYHYVLAELLRRQGEFAAACREFDLVDESANLPAPLVDKQKQLASKQENHSVLLTSEEVEKIFFPVLKLDPLPEMFRPVKATEPDKAEISISQPESLSTSMQSTSMQSTPVQSMPAESTSMQSVSVQPTPAQSMPISPPLPIAPLPARKSKTSAGSGDGAAATTAAASSSPWAQVQTTRR